MKRLVLLLALGISACEREAQDGTAVPSVSAPDAVLPAPTRASKPPAIVPKPEDEAQLDRMILAGFTPHADHLHPPGVNECPLTKGTDVVM